MTRKLTAGELHMLDLIAAEAQDDGWATVSKPVSKLIAPIPRELIEYEAIGDEGRGRVRLTPEGQQLMAARAWL